MTTEPKLKYFKYKEAYNCYSTKVDSLFSIGINWGHGKGDDGVEKYGYLLSINGVKFTNIFPDVQTAEEAAVKYIKEKCKSFLIRVDAVKHI